MATQSAMAAAEEVNSASAPARDEGRDGKVADMKYYDLLNVPASATELELKKAYRKAAIINHPDKGGDEEKFKLIGEAYRVLSDTNLRAEYDRYGKKKPTEEVGLKEATEMVSVERKWLLLRIPMALSHLYSVDILGSFPVWHPLWRRAIRRLHRRDYTP